MKTFKAVATSYEGERKIIQADAKNKTEFIKEARKNGFKINPFKVKDSELFNFIMDETNCNEWDWAEDSEQVKEYLASR
jgi:hypothetical protein